MTYAELGERLGISAEAARQKAIRGRWQRRTANDGRRQVLVDIEDVIASTPPRKPKEDEPADARPTPEEHPADARMIAALDAHIATLKDMIAKAEATIERERQRTDEERTRADAERGRADAERSRVVELLARIEDLHGRRVEAERLQGDVATLERQLQDLRATIEAAARRRPWWKRLAG